MRYRSHPSEVEAVQWTGSNLSEIAEFFGRPPEYYRFNPLTGLEILAGKDGAQGWVPVPVGHWAVRSPGDLSDHWPVEDSYFQAKYQPVED